MTPDGLGETLATEVTTADEVTHVAARRTVALLGHTNRHAHGLDARPLILQGEIAGDLRQYITSLIFTAMPLLGRLMFPVRHLQKIALPLIAEQRFDRPV